MSGTPKPLGPLARGVVVESVTISTQADPFFTLTALSRFASISRRKLVDYINAAEHPLPCYRLPDVGKILVRQSEFLDWLAAYRVEPDVGQIAERVVDEVLR